MSEMWSQEIGRIVFLGTVPRILLATSGVSWAILCPNEHASLPEGYDLALGEILGLLGSTKSLE